MDRQRDIDESLHLEFLHVSFRVLAASKYQNTINKATLKSPQLALGTPSLSADQWLRNEERRIHRIAPKR
jgi:hypothetical protein